MTPLRIFHDDVREAPPGWTLARNNAEALELLRHNDVAYISLDHDLGADVSAGPFAKGDSPDGTGYDLVRLMLDEGLVPPVVIVHSWNPDGARRMVNELMAGHPSCQVLRRLWEGPEAAWYR